MNFGNNSYYFVSLYTNLPVKVDTILYVLCAVNNQYRPNNDEIQLYLFTLLHI